MTIQDFRNILPLLIIAAASVLLLVLIAARRNHRLACWLAGLALAGAFATSLFPSGTMPQAVGGLLAIDGFSLFYSALLSAAGLVVVLLSYPYLQPLREQMEEYYVLILLAVLGAVILAASRHFASFFLGLELLSASLYALIGYLVKSRDRSVEAGVKYLILAAASAAFLLFGMALVYFETGVLGFSDIGVHLAQAGALSPLAIAGFGLIIVGIGFKLALVPFHMWAADVYEGAPAPVSALVATVSKGGVVALLLRFYNEAGGYQFPSLTLLFALFAAASMLGGNLLALLQDNVKRILAYSSIAHLGYLAVAFLAGGKMGAGAATFYLVAYFVTILGAFGIVAHLSSGEEEAERVSDYRALFWRRPWAAAAFTAMLLSLAGIPLTAGFMGKFYIAAAGVEGGLWALLFILVASSVIGLYYYLRIVVAMFSQAEEQKPVKLRLFSGAGLILALLVVALVWLGISPQAMMGWINQWVAG
ncbi:MAG: NADH-quinone oxidoreductase subunit N [Phaeodactylibacter sp.]|nr:NADH-quinone oxidoreductase subunit N [Phaeodactylibacter sp.]MCB9263808.1 NADH-quinone oxidoreductase subunit N [Lewinellaceae bacterium]MCB9288271.1 NADH-quinone oxidoreductase subunit N [Lewinellaceae bacterium]